MITKKELLEKLYVDGSLSECWNNLKKWAESLPDDEPTTIPFQWPVPDGYEVITRDGRKVEQLHKFSGIAFPVIGVVDGSLEVWRDDGSYSAFEEHASDLFLRPTSTP